VALKQRYGDARAVELIQQHHVIVRATLSEARQAEEIETAGDSFLLVFARPSDAVGCALLLRARLRELASRTQAEVFDRVGIHVGEVFVQEQEGALKLFGSQLDLCARVMSLGQANQILMTRFAFDSARQVLRGQDLPGVGQLRWLNHGPYLFKGLEDPVEVCEVRDGTDGSVTPPIGSDKARRHSLADGEPVLGWRPAVDQIVPRTKWVLEKKLGEGGFGEVWLGRHETLKEQRVFKFCFRADRVRSLKREVTLFRLMKEKVGHHPNIVGIQEVFFDEPPYYIVMDYAEGQDLRTWCEAQGGVQKVSPETRLEIVAQVADALQAAHRAGVIHRDVKPSNILVSTPSPPAPRISVKLTDFGIGQVVSQEYLEGMTRSGFTQTMLSPGSSAPAGTHMYMAPELIAGKAADARSDTYSLGVVLYQLLISDLSRPLTTDWAKHIGDPLLREDLERCFAGSPQDRYASASELAHDLRSLDQRRRVHAAHERRVRRQTFLTRALMPVVILVLLGWLFWPKAKPAAISAPARKIAILPFATDTNAPVEDYLSQSLTVELIDGLRLIKGINAMRLTSEKPEDEIRSQLFFYEVPLLVSGSVRRKEGGLEIQCRLTGTASDAGGGQALMATNYTCSPTNLLGIPNELALRIAEGAGVTLIGEDRSRIAKLPTSSPEAYDCYLRARYGQQRLVTLASRKATLLERAVQLDTNFAAAYADLGRAYVDTYFYDDPTNATTLDQKALQATDRALSLDKSLAVAHFAKAYFLWTRRQHWDHAEAIRELRKALELSPYLHEAKIQLTLIYIHAGLLEDGLRLANESEKNNPLDPTGQFLIGNAFFWQGKNGDALNAWSRIFDYYRGNLVHNSYRAVALINLGYTNEALKSLSDSLTYMSSNQADPDPGGLLASAHALLLAKQGREAEAIDKINAALRQKEHFGHFHHALYNIATAYAVMNKPKEALENLRQAAEDGFPCYPLFNSDPNFTNLRETKEFKEFSATQKRGYDKLMQEFGRSAPLTR
jgi:class 3 adenylate cyclase/tetratricopeptide (TPR) repeat protein/TolB-like protein/tRNA A-37 threonylcarbamoyl transferase component Bud32